MVSSSDVMRLFLQGIMSRRMVTEKTARKLWQKCIEAVNSVDENLNVPYNDDRKYWDDWVNKVTEALNPLDLEFAHVHDEFSGEHVYGIVNRNGDEVAQLATEYTAIEIKYFKALLDQIMLASNESYCVSSLVALREVKFVDKSISKTHAEKLLNSFVARGWLVRSRKGRYSLSTRTILELQTYLKANFDDSVHECTICFEMVTRGFACTVQNCQTRLHSRCYSTYRRTRNACPTCKAPWASDEQGTGEKMKKIGEAAFKDGQEKKGRRTRQSDMPEEGSGEEAEAETLEGGEDDEDEPAPTQTQRRKGKKKKNVVSDDEQMEVEEKEEEEEEEEEEEPTGPSRTQPRRSGRR
ncbi:Nse1 non-SMC component of SMC5-6 complex-domain-containing protein [Irpex rosettiformis]|uniref:Nse1 non-SMC component of SMC5-6 complex-domain-containing protein n=1 Tax=Irpex rosettiformis TaxID=378272 RepID=A0ACB8UIA1_9APHY|nr:Nse1 non-SMC component of SMC5-6 complex-domain-containing protein [Irpex rosettiformis]